MKIYVLIDPTTQEVKYVGKTNNVKLRYKAHLNPARFKNTHKFNWIKKLREQKLKPILKVIEECSSENWKEREKYWIKYYLDKGCKLTNKTNGGDGLTFGNQTSFKKGHKIWLGKNHTEESKKKISENSYWKGKITPNAKVVLQYNLDGILLNEYKSAEKAALLTNSQRSHICAVCRGERKTHNNFKWEYK